MPKTPPHPPPPPTIKLGTSNQNTVHLTGFKSFYFRIFYFLTRVLQSLKRNKLIVGTTSGLALQCNGAFSKFIYKPSEWTFHLSTFARQPPDPGLLSIKRDKNSNSSSVTNQLITRNKPYNGSSRFPALQLPIFDHVASFSRAQYNTLTVFRLQDE